jgi:CheY-like chemotaxis protein
MPDTEHLIQTATGAKARVLIVDGDDADRRLLAGMCELFDCTSVLVKDGVEAVEAYSAAPFDIVLMAPDLARMDGLEAARAIRRDAGPDRPVPILAVTASTDPAHLGLCRDAGMSGVLQKPIEASRLLEAVSHALGTSPQGLQATPRS